MFSRRIFELPNIRNCLLFFIALLIFETYEYIATKAQPTCIVVNRINGLLISFLIQTSSFKSFSANEDEK